MVWSIHAIGGSARRRRVDLQPDRLLLLSLGNAGLRFDDRSERVCRGNAAGCVGHLHSHGLCLFGRPNIKIVWLLAAALGILIVALPDASGQLFEADSKQFGSSKMDIVLKEVERRPRASAVEIKITSVGSSVGSSFFILCSIRQLAKLRGPYRYIVKLEEQPKRNQMLVGFLGDAEESPASAGSEFSRAGREAVIDLEQFAPVCDSMK